MSVNPQELPQEELKKRHHRAPQSGYWWSQEDFEDNMFAKAGNPDDQGFYPGSPEDPEELALIMKV